MREVLGVLEVLLAFAIAHSNCDLYTPNFLAKEEKKLTKEEQALKAQKKDSFTLFWNSLFFRLRRKVIT
jgi:hypothetical protein